MNLEMLIPIVAICAPFLFAAWVIKTGIKAKERKRGIKNHEDESSKMADRELEEGIRSLEKRIENLEIIMHSRKNGKE